MMDLLAGMLVVLLLLFWCAGAIVILRLLDIFNTFCEQLIKELESSNEHLR